MKKSLLFLLSILFFNLNVSSNGRHIQSITKENLRIAVVSDVHIQDTSVVRSMNAQLYSTRLFNENYFAFLAVLDDLAKRHIHKVLLSGDLTDNGQPVNVRLVRKVLQRYTKTYGMQFFVMTGNHDPSRPFTVTDSVSGTTWGYKEIHDEWSAFGFSPRKEYLYWATPFSTYSYKDYSYEKATQQASWSKRVYNYPQGMSLLRPAIQDGSYVVEPVKGVWLLAIDAAIYDPLTVKGDSIVAFDGALSGYNKTLQIKRYLLPWITKVAADARKYGKTLIAFSHFPMADYNSGAASYVSGIAAPGRFDVHRFPDPSVSELLADAGVTLHLGGHIHMNDDELFVSKKGNTLHNVLVPSTAGYAPAYKILTIKPGGAISIATIPLDTVSGFKSFFPRYQSEHDSLLRVGKQPLWNDSILTSKDYHQFCEWHLRELVRLRYLPLDFKPIARDQFALMTGKDLFAYVGLQSTEEMKWTGFDFIVDFYKLRFGNELALRDIDPHRLSAYRLLANKVEHREQKTELDQFLFSFCHIFSARLSHLKGEK